MIQTTNSDNKSLKEKWFTLCKYKKWVLLFPFCMTVVAALLADRGQRIWEATATVRIGQITESRISSQIAIANQLKESKFLEQILVRLAKSNLDAEAIKSSYEKNISVNLTRDYEIVEIKIKNTSQQMALALGHAVAEQFQELQNQFFNQQESIMQDRLQILQNNIQSIKATIASLEKKIEEVQKKPDSNSSLLYSILLQSKNLELHETLKEFAYFKDKMHPTHTFPTYVVGDVSVAPLNKSMSAVMIMTFLFSLFISVAIAFLYDSIYRKE